MNSTTVTAAIVLTAAFGSLAPVDAQNGLTEAQRKELVDYHNKVRHDVGVGPVTWSDKAAAVAQRWANHLAATGTFQHNAGRGHYGENIAIDSSLLSGAKAWYSEIKSYRPGTRMGQSGANYQIVGHYTQMVWSSTTRIGAGVAVMRSGRFRGQLVIVCNYDPPGNYTGQVPYGPGARQPAKPLAQPQPTPTPGPSSAKAGFPEGYFYMTTKSAEDQNLVLESSTLTLRKRGDHTGMNWKALPVEGADGYFYLTSEHLEKQNLVLEGSDTKGQAVMVANNKYSGTLWKAVPAGSGYYHLTTAHMEKPGNVLAGNVGKTSGAGAPFDGAPHMVKAASAGPESLWKFFTR